VFRVESCQLAALGLDGSRGSDFVVMCEERALNAGGRGGIGTAMRLLTLLLATMLGGCASKKVDQQYDPATANTRATEQMRMRAVTGGEVASERGAQVLVADPNKEFNPSAARFGRPASVGAKAAHVNEFQFVDRVRTKDFGTRDYTTKGAWMGDLKFGTKEARTKESWFAKKSARTKTFDTKEARDASKSATTRALPGGDRSFLGQGRRQADLDSTGREKIPFGTTDMGPSWTGDLKTLTIEDVKGLLNKN
jgi:hypothetical protein